MPGARQRRALLIVAGLLWACLGAAWPAPAGASALPRYRLSVHLDEKAHTLAGTVTVTLPAGAPAPGNVLWFHLPPNRFAAEDPRGPRRQVASLQFDAGFRSDGHFDPIWPDGFSVGRMAVHAVETEAGAPLPFTLEPNPALPEGYAVQDGLLRVALSAGAGTRTVRIRFTTHLPERYWDGWSEAGLLTDGWYPSLALQRGEAWDLDVWAPRGGRFEAQVTVDGEGLLLLGNGRSWQMAPGDTAEMPPGAGALRTLPLVFVPTARGSIRHGYDLSLYSYFHPEHERLGRKALEIAEAFRRHVRREYGLVPPNTRLAIVEVDLPPGDIVTVGNLVLVPSAYYRNAAALDRIFVAQLARAVAQVWFGEAVWSNRDTQSWLHLGLAGFLALDFFDALYGRDAGVHDLMDWLQPKYREHFFEAPLRGLMRGEQDAPLMLSLEHYPKYRTAMLVAYNKAPVVLRSLRYLIGQGAFARALNALYRRYRYTEVTESTLRAEMEAASDRDLAPFFAHWFHGTPQVQLSVERWERIPAAQGETLVVHVRRVAPPQTPVDVRVTTASGQTFERRWEGDETTTALRFALPGPPTEIAIDPDEYWLELDRRDNRHELLFRIRPVFDWSKQREVLVAVRATAGGNSTDGNYYGLGVNMTLNENNALRIMPIYGDRTGLHNYQLSWNRSQFVVPQLSLGLTLERLAGSTRQSASFGYAVLDQERHQLNTNLSLNAEVVRADTLRRADGTVHEQPRSRADNVGAGITYAYQTGRGYQTNLGLAIVDSRPGYGSDYTFTSYRLHTGHSLALGGAHLLSANLRRAGVEGASALQFRSALGGPGALRGYPRSLQLTHEETVLAQLEYGLVLSRHAIGSAAQVRRTTMYVFAEAGRGWDHGEVFGEAPRRQDVGIGLELRVNVMRLTELPLRIDIAVPVRDAEYRDPQFVLFGLLSF